VRGNSARQENLDYRLGLRLLRRLGRAEFEEIAESQTETANKADIEEVAPGDPFKMRGIVIPSYRFFITHGVIRLILRFLIQCFR